MTKDRHAGPALRPTVEPTDRAAARPTDRLPALRTQRSFAVQAAAGHLAAAKETAPTGRSSGDWLARAVGVGLVALAFTTARGPDKSQAATPGTSFDLQLASGALLAGGPAAAVTARPPLPIERAPGEATPGQVLPPQLDAARIQLAALTAATGTASDLPAARVDRGGRAPTHDQLGPRGNTGTYALMAAVSGRQPGLSASDPMAAPLVAAPPVAARPRTLIDFAKAAAADAADLSGGVLLERRRGGGVRMAALGKPATTGNRVASGGGLDSRIATGSQRVSCLPGPLKRVLNEVVSNFGPVRINSTWRSSEHNRRVGGAGRSMHLECRAIDFAYRGSRRDRVIRFLRAHAAVGGLGNYGSGGHIHIDDGPHRSW